MSEAKQIFISYSSNDVSFASQLHEDLGKHGIKAWRDKTHIRANENWADAIFSALKKSHIMILVISKSSMLSEEVYREWHYFLSTHKPIVSIWLEDCDIHFRLAPLQRIDFRSISNYQVQLNQLIYELSLLMQTTIEIPSQRQVVANSAFSADGKPTWEHILNIARQFTNEMLGVRYKEKYSSDCYSDRSGIKTHLSNFLDSSKRVMVVTGRAGTGKSTFVCNLSQHPPKNTLVLLQDCAHLDLEQDMTIDQYLMKIFKIRNSFKELIANLYKDDPSLKIVILFDAVNEFYDRERLLNEIAVFLRGIDTGGIKVLITSRIPVWDSIKRHFTIPSEFEFHTSGINSYVNLANFDIVEAKATYDLYKHSYDLKSNFDELPPHVQNFLSQPLFLKLTAEAYIGQAIPHDVVLQKVFADYVLRCLGADGPNSNEYRVLKRAIQLMYENKKRELEVSLLKNDPAVDPSGLSLSNSRTVQ